MFSRTGRHICRGQKSNYRFKDNPAYAKSKKKAKLVGHKCQCLFMFFFFFFCLSSSLKRPFSLEFPTPDYVGAGHSANKALLFLKEQTISWKKKEINLLKRAKGRCCNNRLHAVNSQIYIPSSKQLMLRDD